MDHLPQVDGGIRPVSGENQSYIGELEGEIERLKDLNRQNWEWGTALTAEVAELKRELKTVREQAEADMDRAIAIWGDGQETVRLLTDTIASLEARLALRP